MRYENMLLSTNKYIIRAESKGDNMKKKYLAELIGDEYKSWNKKKIIITAPTGMGKTTFIVQVLLPYLKERKRKLLILCNRKLLRKQYLHDLVLRYNNYVELETSVNIMTYQQLAEHVRSGASVESLFYEFHALVCDEAHYFYSDSDFNSFGTYALLQFIVYAGIGKELIFMSATTEEVKPLIVKTIQNCFTKLKRTRENWRFDDDCGNIIIKDFSSLGNYSRFKCICLPDEDTLCGILAESPYKSILFVDQKDKGFRLREMLIQTNKVKSREVVVLNAENLDDDCNSTVVRNLAISHKLMARVLITTSVLDNGVSFHDSEVRNLVIITESKVSFLQMLGRIRDENVKHCNLYFIRRTEDSFLYRMNRYQKDCELFKTLEQKKINVNPSYYNRTVWDNSNVELAEFYRKSLVLTQHNYQFFVLPDTKFGFAYGDEGLYINEFAKRKIGDMYLAELKFYSLAISNPLNVIYEQMSWIGKEPEELEVQESEYMRVRASMFIDTLLTVKNFTNKEMQDFKSKLVRDFRKDFFPDILSKNGTLATDKLENICKRYGLRLEKESDSDRRMTYSIKVDNLSEEGDKIGR